MKWSIKLLNILITLASVLTAKTLLWQESTVIDFSDNSLNNVIVTNTDDGEVRLPSIITKVQDDKIVMNQYRFTSRNSQGDFIRTWIENDNLYVRKFSKDSIEISEKLQVNNDEIPSLEYSSMLFCRSAMLDDGSFCVVWNNGTDDHRNVFKGQIFNSNNIKLSDSFEIRAWSSISIPTIFPCNSENNFWILYPDKELSTDNMKAYVRKISVDNNVDGEDIQLFPDRATQQFGSSIVQNSNNEFAISWSESPFNDNVANSLDLYICKFDSNLNRISNPKKVNDDNKYVSQTQPYSVINDNDELILCWCDGREGEYWHFNVYGQLFDSELNKLNSNFRINNKDYFDNRMPEIIQENGTYKILWSVYDQDSEQYLTKYNIWGFGEVLAGEMNSSVHSVGEEGAKFLNFISDGTSQQETELKFQIRSALTMDELDMASWYGPESTDDFYYLNDTSTINLIHEDNALIQYRALFHTDESGYSPILNSVSVSYQPNDSIPPPLPQNIVAEPGYSSVNLSWDSPDDDVEIIKIYRSHTHKLYSAVNVGELTDDITEFTDTTVIAGEEYYYALYCIDKSGNSSGLSEAVKAVPLARKIYVGPNGSSGDGTIASPYCTIQEGLKNAHQKDTIIVLPGDYNGDIELKEDISLIGADVTSTKIYGSILAANNTVISNLTIISNGFYGIKNPRGCTVTIKDNHITTTENNQNPAIKSGMETSPRIYRNYITNFYMGIHCLSSRPVRIKNNLITTQVGMIHSAYESENASIIENNTIISSEPGWACIKLSRGKHYVVNNIIIGNGEGYGIQAGRDAHIRAEYNNVWQHQENYREFTPGDGNISSDPMFVSEATLNYDLSSLSPCVNSGHPKENYNDLDQTRNNMGAFGGQDPINIYPADFLMKSVSLDRISGYPGDTVFCNLTLDNCSHVNNTHFKISFDSEVLNFIDAQLGIDLDDVTLEYFFSENGNLELKTIGELSEINGPLARIRFAVNSTVKAGDSSPINFEFLELLDNLSSEIMIKSIRNGLFIVNQGNDEGQYVFVDCANENFGDGSQGNPYNQISIAVQQATSGDTILVNAGVYEDNFDFKNDLFLRGAGAKVTRLKLKSTSMPIINFNNIEKGEVSGFRFVSNGESSHDGLLRFVNSEVEILRNVVESSEIYNFLDGVNIESGAKPYFKNNFFNYAQIKISASKPVFEKNHFVNGDVSFGIFCHSGASPSFINNRIFSTCYFSNVDSIKFINNKLYSESALVSLRIAESDNIEIMNNYFSSQSSEQGHGVHVNNSTNLKIYNNLFYKLKTGLKETLSETELYNNIFYDISSSAVQHSEETLLGYNAFFNNFINYQNSSEGIDDVNADPMFADVENERFQLLPDSPCIDKGNPSDQFNDFDGSRNDIGIYGGQYNTGRLSDHQMVLEGDTLEACINDTIEMVFHGNFMENVAKIGMNISFSENSLRLVKLNTTGIAKGMALSILEKSDNYYQVGLDGINGISESSGDLFKINFLVNGQKGSDIEIAINNVEIENIFSQQIETVEINNGFIKVNPTSLDEDDVAVLNEYVLEQNYPNPFNGQTSIRFYLPQKENVELIIYNIQGKLVSRIRENVMNQGYHIIKWNGKNSNGENVTSGLYFYQLKTNKFRKTRKLLYIK